MFCHSQRIALYSAIFCRAAIVLITAVPADIVQSAPDPVVAIVNGTKICRSAIELLQHALSQQGQDVIANIVLREDMRQHKLDQTSEVVAQLAEMERCLFWYVYQIYVIEPQITDAVLRAQERRYSKPRFGDA